MDEEIEIEIGTGNSVRNINELRREMQMLRGEMATAEGEEFQKLSQRASELNAEMARTNSLVTDSGSAFTNFNTMLGRTSKSLLTLDFGQAAEQAQMLKTISGQLTFKSMIGGLKQATGAIRTMGAAILSNPLFLLAAVVVAIGVAIVKFGDKIKPIKAIFEAIGAAVEWVIQTLKDMLDWLGLTSFAADEEAEKEKKRQADMAAAREAAHNQYIKEKELEIAEMKASGASIEEIEAAEISLAQTRLEAAKTKLRLEEQTRQAFIDTMKVLGRLDVATQMQIELDEMRNKVKEEEIGLLQTISRIENRKEAEAKTNHQNAVQREQERIRLQAEFEKSRLDAARRIEDIETQLIDDDFERSVTANQIKFERMREDALSNEKLTQEERIRLIELYNEQEVAKLDELNTKKREREEAEQQKILDMRNAFFEQLDEERERTEEEQSERRMEKEVERLRNLLEAKAITQEEFDALELQRHEEHQNRLAAITENRLADEDTARRAAQQAALESGLELFNNLAMLAEEGSAAQKAAALVSIIAAQAEAIAKAVPVALEAASGTGPAAPFVFAATLAGIGASIAASIGSAKSLLGAGGGGGTNPTAGAVAPIINIQGQQPSFSNFNDNFAGDMTATSSGAFILSSELSDEEERNNQLKLKKSL
jgi:hypothetical protein